MNFFKRLLLLFLGLALMALVTVLFLVPERVDSLANLLVEQPATSRLLLAVVADLVIFVVLFLLLRAPARPKSAGLVVQTSGALADVSLESAQSRILKAVRAVPGVVTADAKLQAQNGKADIDMNVGVSGDNINVPEKQKEIDRALRQVTLKQLGLKLASRPRVHIQLLTDADVRALEPAPLPVEPTVQRFEPLPEEPPVRRRYEAETPVAPMAQPIYEPPPTPRRESTAPRTFEREPEPAYLEDVVTDWSPPEPLDEPEPIAESPVIEPVPDMPEPVTEPPVIEHVEAEVEVVPPELPEVPMDVTETELDALMLSDLDPDHEIDTPPDSSEIPDTGLIQEDDERTRPAGTDSDEPEKAET